MIKLIGKSTIAKLTYHSDSSITLRLWRVHMMRNDTQHRKSVVTIAVTLFWRVLSCLTIVGFWDAPDLSEDRLVRMFMTA